MFIWEIDGARRHIERRRNRQARKLPIEMVGVFVRSMGLVCERDFTDESAESNQITIDCIVRAIVDLHIIVNGLMSIVIVSSSARIEWRAKPINQQPQKPNPEPKSKYSVIFIKLN